MGLVGLDGGRMTIQPKVSFTVELAVSDGQFQRATTHSLFRRLVSSPCSTPTTESLAAEC